LSALNTLGVIWLVLVTTKCFAATAVPPIARNSAIVAIHVDGLRIGVLLSVGMTELVI
jgi:hypothetical protein